MTKTTRRFLQQAQKFLALLQSGETIRVGSYEDVGGVSKYLEATGRIRVRHSFIIGNSYWDLVV